jgi:PAS domain S-box-containing protein
VRARRTPPVGDPLIQQTLLGEAVDHGPAAIFVMGDDRKYVAVNETACRLLGYDRAELLALDPADLAPESDVDAKLEELDRTGSHNGRVRLRTKSGELIPFNYRTSAATAAHMRFWISIAFPE